MKVWLALDGVGHPLDAPPDSPWAQALTTLRPLVDAGAALDATLGVPGLPQSGTGQSCWLTGQDAVRLMGEHFGPHPGPTLQRLLRAQALPVRLVQAGARTALVNHYAPAYFAPQRRPRVGCFPFAFQAAGLPLNPSGLPLVPASLGLGFQAPWTPAGLGLEDLERLGTQLARAARDWDLLVLDLWFSDLLGHAGREPVPPEVRAAARAYLQRVDALLRGLLEGGADVALSSDHGNMEDLGVKSHTVARVPLAASTEILGPADVVGGGRWLAAWAGLSPAPEQKDDLAP
ncbi:metalloenzyme domain protein [Deinococcus hohokamensis]|uniref:Metalloenzyme domain protein n=1 Tax=Deinococcus hohokamensis TaxID=309883 RepID=A0ABV9IFC0_9DEIO